MPTIASSRNRLAFARTLNSVGVYTLGAAPRPVLVSSFWDIQPQFSPDGTQLVFTLVAFGRGARHLARRGGRLQCAPVDARARERAQGSPSWSPDGRQIAFDAQGDDGRLAIWTIDADGGAPRRITKGARRSAHADVVPRRALDLLPADQGQRSDTWRVPASGGSAERVTREGSASFATRVDGRQGPRSTSENFADSPLLALPLAGGPARQLLPCVHGVNFAVGPAGIYYAACGPGPERSIHLLDRAGTRSGARERSRHRAPSSSTAWPWRPMARPS